MDSWEDTSKEALLATNSRVPSSYRPPSPSQPRSRPPSSLANRISREIKGVSETNLFGPQRNDQSSIYPSGLSEKPASEGRRELFLKGPMSKTRPAKPTGSFAALEPIVRPAIYFLIGIILAFGHHQFNTWAEGRTVGTNPSIPQEWVFRIGTAFAIAFQTILASSLAFVTCQLLWFYTRRQHMSMIDINTLYQVERRDLAATVLSDAIFRSPLLVTATLLSFLLPITAVFTPASLGVTTSSFDVLRPCQVSAANFSVNQAPTLFRHNATAGNYLGGPTSSIQRLADSTFAGQSIPPLPQYCGKNCTYQTSIDSMTFQCERNVPLPAGHLGDTELSNLGPGTRVFWNASMAGPEADPPSPFYVGWQTGAMSRHFDGSVGTNGSALCTPTKAHYDFTVRTINGEQFVSYNMTPTGPLKSTTTATTGEAAEEGYIALQVGAVTLAARSRLLGVVSWLYYPVARVNIYNDSSPVLLSSFLNVSDTDAASERGSQA
ncbi:hypothetical protein M407DRAFT_23468 [Tulasnella calospora MUT 4182]|uniref:Uncharacterized protein n=1 Tax=Tulasnella calospora MUT 4182 TaxID=1051891 RepID=A0A0C3QAI7_9AGAM|nr:hypothetical protein M407DRAFT_23468 [Tulasnella calospora MUT 4182]